MIALAADHAGYPLKEEIKKHLLERGFDVKDFGTDSDKSVDYAVFAKIAGEAVASGECKLGIFCCGTGVGISLACNKVEGIRACCCSEPYSAEMSKRHNNSNVICFGARVIGIETAKQIVDAWTGATFEGGRHQRRVDEIMEIEATQKLKVADEA